MVVLNNQSENRLQRYDFYLIFLQNDFEC